MAEGLPRFKLQEIRAFDPPSLLRVSESHLSASQGRTSFLWLIWGGGAGNGASAGNSFVSQEPTSQVGW